MDVFGRRYGELAARLLAARLDPGKVSAEEMIQWAKNNMAAYKIPSAIVFREELPTNMVGKVLRRLLREEELSA